MLQRRLTKGYSIQDGERLTYISQSHRIMGTFQRVGVDKRCVYFKFTTVSGKRRPRGKRLVFRV